MSKQQPTAAIYLRVSSKSQADRNSIESQRVQLPNFAKLHGWRVVQTFEDNGISGSTLAARPGALALLDYLRKTGAEYVVICDPARWGRFAKGKGERAAVKLLAEVDVMTDMCAETNTILVTTDNLIFDPTGGDVVEQRSAFANAVSVAGKQNRMMGRKVARSKIIRLARGEWPFGLTPYGLRFDRAARTFVEYKPESKILKRAFAWYAAGDSDAAISQRLRDRGVPTSSQRHEGDKNKCMWRQSTVRTILSNPVYSTGAIESNLRDAFERYRESCATDHVALDLPEDIVPEGGVVKFTVPVLVDVKTWERCQELRLDKVSRPGPKTKRDNFLFQPFLRCAACGSAIEHGYVKHGRYVYYGCRRHRSEQYRDGREFCGLPRFNADETDASLWETVWSRLLEPGKLLADWHAGKDKKAGRTAAEVEGELAEIDKALADAQAERLRYVKLYGAGAIPAGELDGLVAEINSRLLTLQGDRARLAAELNSANDQDGDVEVLRERAAWLQAALAGRKGSKVREQIDALSYADKRRLLGYVLRPRSIALLADKALPPEEWIEARHGIALDFMALPVDPARLLDGLAAVGIKPVLGSIRATRSPAATARPGPARPGRRAQRPGRRSR
jgi:DNA invertase Pin-like site-specific DNA recombinase